MAAVNVSPVDGLVTDEDMTETEIALVLNTMPSASVTISLSSSDNTEGTVLPTTIVFSVNDWDIPQIATITGVDDQDVDGDIDYSIEFSVSSDDLEYDGAQVDPVTVTNQDNDIAPPAADVTVLPVSGLLTSEDMTTADISVVLDTQPTDTVTISASSSDTSEGTVAPAELQFDAMSWNTPQQFTVTGVDDQQVDGDIAYEISYTP